MNTMKGLPLLLMPLLLPDLAETLMFQSDAVSSQWDTWAFMENGTYYAFYLVTEHSPGEGFGVATSANGVTGWVDHGYVWHSPDWAQNHWWEGTGAVWRAADFNKTGRYVINYSRHPNGGYQQIMFAESFDLINWTRPAPFDDIIFNITAPWYKNPGRWDCIYSTPQSPWLGSPRDSYPRYGWWTATAPSPSADMGYGKTDDGYTWTALPSPAMNPPISSEVGAVEYITYANGTKAAWFAMLGHGGMVVYSSPTADGPYTIQPKNAYVLTGSCYFARFFRPATGGDVYVTHQSYSHVGRTYIAPYKRVDVDNNGVLRFKYFDTVGVLQGRKMPQTSNSTAPWFNLQANVSVGAVVRYTLTLPRPALSGGSATTVDDPAVAVEMVGGTVVYLAINGSGVCTVGSAILDVHGIATVTTVLGSWDRQLDLTPGQTVDVTVLYRREMLELYLNDYLLPVQLMPNTGTGRLGALPAGANGGALALKSAAAMNLPGTAVWPPAGPPSPAPPPPVPRNDLSPQGTATCSGRFGPTYDCRYGTDGNLATRWSSELPYDGSPRWLSVHFSTPKSVSKAVLVWELAWAKGYALQAANGTTQTWATFYNTTSGTGGTETLTGFGTVTASDYRIYCYERFPGSAWGFSLYEFELFE
mmetsp:Transcript_35342/g.92425  ORF Transcript_35342/g.92425 Transcript_35342/m.92425 type:complete len:644 (+) Transcript_35342:71-2002(+)